LIDCFGQFNEWTNGFCIFQRSLEFFQLLFGGSQFTVLTRGREKEEYTTLKDWDNQLIEIKNHIIYNEKNILCYLKRKVSDRTTRGGTGAIFRLATVTGNTFNSSSMIKHCGQEIKERRKRSLNRPTTSRWASVR
jgi:hypothetical protein